MADDSVLLMRSTREDVKRFINTPTWLDMTILLKADIDSSRDALENIDSVLDEAAVNIIRGRIDEARAVLVLPITILENIDLAEDEDEDESEERIDDEV